MLWVIGYIPEASFWQAVDMVVFSGCSWSHRSVATIPYIFLVPARPHAVIVCSVKYLNSLAPRCPFAPSPLFCRCLVHQEEADYDFVAWLDRITRYPCNY